MGFEEFRLRNHLILKDTDFLQDGKHIYYIDGGLANMCKIEDFSEAIYHHWNDKKFIVRTKVMEYEIEVIIKNEEIKIHKKVKIVE